MLILVSGGTATLRTLNDGRFGVLVVPRARALPDSLPLRPGKWAMDNGAYAGLDVPLFLQMLKSFHRQPGCLWVTAPDVVGKADETLALWPFWSQLIRGVGFAPALVAQDGLTVDRVPWSELGALFIGGTTEFKMSPAARGLVAYANARGIWTHMGRVNTRARHREAERWGIQSIDGSSRSRFPATQIAKDQRWMDEWDDQPAFL